MASFGTTVGAIAIVLFLLLGIAHSLDLPPSPAGAVVGPIVEQQPPAGCPQANASACDPRQEPQGSVPS